MSHEIDKITDPQARAFAEACYDQNSIAELSECTDIADQRDCTNWGISADDWRKAVAAALADRLADRLAEKRG